MLRQLLQADRGGACWAAVCGVISFCTYHGVLPRSLSQRMPARQGARAPAAFLFAGLHVDSMHREGSTRRGDPHARLERRKAGVLWGLGFSCRCRRRLLRWAVSRLARTGPGFGVLSQPSVRLIPTGQSPRPGTLAVVSEPMI
jgi:hypothetical protein